MKNRFSLLSLLWTLLIFSGCSSRQVLSSDYNVIPLPVSISLQEEGTPFVLKPSTVVYCPEGDSLLLKNAELLTGYVARQVGFELRITHDDQARNIIRLGSGLQAENAEAYTLVVTPQAVEIEGASAAGTFYGVQTLRKSLPVTDGKVRIALAPVRIEDAPRFSYRGLHLDVARHMFPVEFIKKYIDLLALHNMNMFHWHLTDDQGWRIEIKRYPRLTEVGGWRKATLVSHWEKPDHKYDETPYGGYYTQDEIRDIVRYAADRHVEIVPEIDLPGHMLAAVAAYPELGCTGGPYETGTRWGVYDDVLCAGKEEVYEFLEGVFSEIVALFPGRYIHIGGDECPKTRWKSCPDCQAFIRSHGIVSQGKRTREEQLQSYMMSQISDFLGKHGRKVIGWDEILEGGGVKSATIMSWRGTQGGVDAARNGWDAIMVPYQYLYLDYAQSRDEGEPLSIGGYLPLSKVYSYEPLSGELASNPEMGAHVIGVQGNLWTEYFRTAELVEYMAIPRVDAVSEIQWTRPERKNYENFLGRLNRMRALYDRLGYGYASHGFDEGQSGDNQDM